MAELEPDSLPEQRILRRAIRHELRRVDPALRVVAEEFLTETTTVDLLGRGSRGELVAIRIGRGDDDDRLLTGLLADRAWLTPRLADWLKLAPQLDLDPAAAVRALLVCPEFRRETCSAVALFPEQTVGLIRYHCLPRQHGRLVVLLEAMKLDQPIRRGASPDAIVGCIPSSDPSFDIARAGSTRPAGTRAEPWPPGPSPAANEDRPSSSCFRTGLTDADLRSPPDSLTRTG